MPDRMPPGGAAQLRPGEALTGRRSPLIVTWGNVSVEVRVRPLYGRVEAQHRGRALRRETQHRGGRACSVHGAYRDDEVVAGLPRARCRTRQLSLEPGEG